MEKFYIISTGETVTGSIEGNDEMFDGDLFYQILTVDGKKYKAFYLEEDQAEEDKDDYGHLILDRVEYNRISYIEELD